MGNLCGGKSKSKELKATIALIGIDNAGKTTLLTAIQGEVDQDAMPTVGFSMAKVQRNKKETYTFYDLGGGAKIRGIWPRYYASLHAAIFVVDASDKERLDEARIALHDALNDPLFKGKTIVVFANKQDVQGCLTPAEISEGLQLHDFKESRYNIFGCIAKTARGKPVDKNISAGVKWLSEALHACFEEIDERVSKDMAEENLREAEARKKKMEEIMKRRAEEERLEKEQKEREAAEAAAADQNEDGTEGDDDGEEEQEDDDGKNLDEAHAREQTEEPRPRSTSPQHSPSHYKRNQVVPSDDLPSESSQGVV